MFLYFDMLYGGLGGRGDWSGDVGEEPEMGMGMGWMSVGGFNVWVYIFIYVRRGFGLEFCGRGLGMG